MASDGPKTGAGNGTGGGAAGITGSAKNSMTPGFLGGAGGGEKPVGLSDKNEKGAGVLGSAENAATNANLNQKPDDIDGASEGEEDVDDVNYSGNGREDENEVFGGLFSTKKGPAGVIIGLIAFTMMIIGSTKLMQPFNLIEQLRVSFNSMQTSAAARSNVFVKYQLNNGLIKSPYNNKFLGIGAKGGFSLSNKQKQKLASRGIKTEEVDTDSGKKTVMTYEDSSGKRKIVVATDDDVGRIKATSGFENDEVMTFKNAFDNDSDFFKAYRDSSLTWRGAIANWFESATLKFLTENKLTRNLFASYRNTGDESQNKANITDLMVKGTDTVQDGGVKRTSMDPDKDSDGKATGTAKSDADGQPEGAKSIKVSDFEGPDGAAKVRAEIEEIRTKYGGNKTDAGSGITGIAQAAANYTCLAFNFLGGVSLLVAAAQTLQIVHAGMAFFETFDKIKAGDGDNAAGHEMAATLNEPGEDTYYEVENKGTGNVNVTGMMNEWNNSSTVPISDDRRQAATADITNLNDNFADTFQTKKTHVKDNAMNSEAINSKLSNRKINAKAPEIKQLNFASNIATIMGGLGVSMASFTGCSIAKIVSNGASVVESVITIGSCIAGAAGAAFSFGATLLACLPELGEIASGIALSVGIGVLIGGIISTVTPVVAGLLTRNIIKYMKGKLWGSAITYASNKTMGDTHRFNGGSLGNLDKYLAFNVAQQETIAEEARYDRLTKSPFDASSQYTFLGTLLTQLMNFTSANSLMSTIMSTNSVLSNSIIALTPTASAYDISSDIVDNYDEVCPYLDSIDAVGDAFCNPYSVTDMDTMGYDPVDLVNKLNDSHNFVEDDFTEDGNVKIKADSGLADYILFCDDRTSAFGIVDQNIVNKVANFAQVNSESGTFNNAVNSGIGAIPIVGDTIDVVTNSQALANAGYVGGGSCVAGNNVSNGVNWEEAKKYQRFIEDQSLMESMGIIEESAVTAFLDEYRVDHPLDNSYEGILARYSGMEKEDVVALLDIIDYGTYLANYDPTTRYAFGQEIKPEIKNELKFDNEQKVAYVVLLNTIEFADVRNRSFVV